MYAIIKTGGKQYRVEKGDVVRVERLEAAVGSSVTLDEVLLVGGEGDARGGRSARRGRVGRRAPSSSRAATQDPCLQVQEAQALPAHAGSPPVLSRPCGSTRSRPDRSAIDMAHKKGQGSSRNGRDSNSQRLGVKRFGGQAVRGRHDHPAPARHQVEAGPERGPGARTTRSSRSSTASSASRTTARGRGA